VLNQHIFKVLPDERKLTPRYAFLILLRVQADIEKQAHGFKASFVHVKKSDLVGIQLPVPPTKAEQEAIADALSDADALLESLEQLIAKKRYFKQGVMQELLRPKNGWSGKMLGGSTEIITKGTTPTSIGRDFTPSGINFLKAESISESGQPIPSKMAFIDEVTHKLLKRSQLTEGDILISIAGVLGRVGRVNKDVLPANINQALAIIRLDENTEFERGYLFYYLRSPMIEQQINDINVQAAQANISLQNVRDFQVHVPPSQEEQAAIANILSDMDAEIAALEAKLAKYRQIKQGMMHNLLTGRIRLI
jgi:type I restriction enzyme S subunit